MAMGRHAMRLAGIAAALVLTASAAPSQDYPNRLVTLVNPAQAGSTTDVLARALAQGLASRLGQQFVVVNNAGGGGAIGTAQAARAPADGYSLFFGAVYVLSVLPAARAVEIGYKSDALVPICQTVSNAMAVVVAESSKFKTLADLVAAARAAPGTVNYGHQGPGSIPNLAMEEFLETARLDIKGIPYRGDPGVLTDVMSGSIDSGAVVLGALQGKPVRVLAVFAGERHPGFPDAPTAREQGFDVAPISFGGLMAPAGTPEPIIARLVDACAGAAKDEAYATAASRAAQPPSYYADRATFAARLTRDIEVKARLLAKMPKQ
jgi:tripartite-type tricarboxylate transporter receptor subunit TctC